MDVRERIATHAIRLFSEKGYAQTSVREIVEAAGVTKPTLYYHFGSKEGLFQTLLSERLSQADALMQGTLAQTDRTVRERLHNVCSLHLAQIQAAPEFNRFVTRLVLSPGSSGPQIDVSQIVGRDAHFFSELFAQGIASGELRADLNPIDLALAFQGIWHFRVFSSMTASSCEEISLDEQTLDRLISIFFHGVTP